MTNIRYAYLLLLSWAQFTVVSSFYASVTPFSHKFRWSGSGARGWKVMLQQLFICQRNPISLSPGGLSIKSFWCCIVCQNSLYIKFVDMWCVEFSFKEFASKPVKEINSQEENDVAPEGGGGGGGGGGCKASLFVCPCSSIQLSSRCLQRTTPCAKSG